MRHVAFLTIGISVLAACGGGDSAGGKQNDDAGLGARAFTPAALKAAVSM